MTVTSVSMTSDLRLARVFVSFINNSRSIESLMDELNSRIKFYKYHVSQKWHTKFMPELEFHYDESLKRAEKITKLMRKISD